MWKLALGGDHTVHDHPGDGEERKHKVYAVINGAHFRELALLVEIGRKRARQTACTTRTRGPVDTWSRVADQWVRARNC